MPVVGIVAVVLVALALMPGAGRRVRQSPPIRHTRMRFRRWRGRRLHRADGQPLPERKRAPRRRGVRSRLRRAGRKLTHPSRTVRHWWYRRVDGRS
ncbi:MAG TPA: hypothetical protein VGO03_16045 [Acidimicrobiia bacterium]